MALLMALAAATIGVLVATPAPLALRILAGTWTACAALLAANRLPFVPGASAPRAFALHASGEVAVQSHDGDWRRGALRDGGFVAPWLVIVRWRPEGARLDRTILLVPGMADAETMRNIRVILRWR